MFGLRSRAVFRRIRLSTFLLLLTIASLSVALFAQGRGAARVQDNYRNMLRSLAPTIPGGTGILSSHVTMNRFRASVEGDRLLVRAEATLMDRMRNPAFLWWLRVTDPSSKALLFERRFDELLIVPAVGVEIKPMFTSEVGTGLPPGRYRVDLQLCRVAPETDLLGMTYPDANGPSRAVGGNAIVEINASKQSPASAISPRPVGISFDL